VLVQELREQIESGQERQFHTTLGQVSIASDATHLEVRGTYDGDSEESNVEFQLDELAESSLARLLDINKTYLHRCPPDLKTANINHWLNAHRDAEVVFETSRGSVTSVHEEGLLIVPIPRVLDVVSNVFQPTDEIVDIKRDSKVFQLDLKVANSSIEVANPDRIEGRPEVGDITHGGVRILTRPQEVIAPTVTTYLHRIWCRNGSAEDYESNSIHLRGNTVDEVIAEMELKAREVLSGLEQKLQAYANMATVSVPGNPSDFVFQVASERQVGSRMIRHLMELATQLPENATLYDVQNLFTQAANEGSFANSTLLQSIGGDLAFATERMLHRCNSCERIL